MPRIYLAHGGQILQQTFHNMIGGILMSPFKGPGHPLPHVHAHHGRCMMSALHSTSRLLLHFVSERQEARLAHIIIQHPPAMPHGRVEALTSLLMARCLMYYYYHHHYYTFNVQGRQLRPIRRMH